MKKVLSISLAVIFLSQVFVNVSIGVYYHINKASIIRQLCENKNNPKMHCNGHCFLSKQLKKAEEGERNHAQQVLKEKNEIIANEISNFQVRYFPVLNAGKFHHFSSHLYLSDSAKSLLKPPSA